MKKFLSILLVLVMLIAFTTQTAASGSINIPVSNNVHTFSAGTFEIDLNRDLYVGRINVGWNGNANNRVTVTWTGNEGEVDVTVYTIANNRQETGVLKIAIEQTDNVQNVVFTLTRVNGQRLQTVVEVPRRLTNDEKAVSLVCVYRTLESIRIMTVDIGTRMRGLPGEREAIEWLIGEFDKLGLETEIHQFTSGQQMQNIAYITIHNAPDFYGVGEFFQTNPADGSVRRGGPFMPWHGHTWEAGAAANGHIVEIAQLVDGHIYTITPNGALVTGEVVYVSVPTGTVSIATAQALFEEADVEGKIVLIGRGANANIATAASNAGAIALKGHSAVGGRGNFGQASSPAVTAGTTIPVVGLALCHGEWLKSMIQQETVTVDILTRRYITPYSWNAIGVKPAVNDPENAPILYVIGHIDTVIGAPGANDNASGVAVTLEAARAFAQLDTPDVELRFMGIGHEESGLRGAVQYVNRKSQADRDRVIGVFNMDMTASADHEYAPYWTMATVNGLPNLVTQTFMATADRLGYVGILEQSQFSSSDHVPFHNAGMPAAMGIWMGRQRPGMITPSNFTIERFYHTPQDTIEENICIIRLGMCIRIVTAAVFELALNAGNLNAAPAFAPFAVASWDTYILTGAYADELIAAID